MRNFLQIYTAVWASVPVAYILFQSLWGTGTSHRIICFHTPVYHHNVTWCWSFLSPDRLDTALSLSWVTEILMSFKAELSSEYLLSSVLSSLCVFTYGFELLCASEDALTNTLPPLQQHNPAEYTLMLYKFISQRCKMLLIKHTVTLIILWLCDSTGMSRLSPT